MVSFFLAVDSKTKCGLKARFRICFLVYFLNLALYNVQASVLEMYASASFAYLNI